LGQFLGDIIVGTQRFNSMKTTIQLISACLLALAAAAVDSPTAPIFQARLVLDLPSDQTEQMVITQKRGDVVHKHNLAVDKKVLFDQTALESVKMIPDERAHMPRIELTFTEAGKKQLYAAPRIDREIPGGKAEINGNFNEEEAKTLVAKISESLQKR
jgi:preprotein translocase subunit SecD